MISCLIASLILFTPMSGVVSGGREVFFATENGLLPLQQWMSVPSIANYSGSTFTEMTLRNGVRKSFRVVSSGETAGIHPLIASQVTEDLSTFQMILGDSRIDCIKSEDIMSYAIAYKSLSFDFRGRSFDKLYPACEYSDNYLLFALAENTTLLGLSCPLTESFSVGPAYSTGANGGKFWLMAETSYGPFRIVSAPAIDDENNYRRIHGVVDYRESQLICGWDGLDYFGRLSYQRNNFVAMASYPDTGIMFGCHVDDDVLLILSQREEGWFQGELQGKYSCFTAGIEFLRSSTDEFSWGVSLGIDMGYNSLDESVFSDSYWYDQIAVTSFLN